MSEFSVTYYEANTITASSVNVAGANYQCSRKKCQHSLKSVTIFVFYLYLVKI